MDDSTNEIKDQFGHWHSKEEFENINERISEMELLELLEK
jgi:hypothetical protein